MKEMNRRDFVKGALSVGTMGAIGMLTGFSSFASEEEKGSGAIYTPGTYTASAQGYDSEVTVTVTFDETHITEVIVDSSKETETVGAVAAERLSEQVMNAQSSAIDGVTGASHTSKAVKAAVADCISQASGGAITEGGDIAVEDETFEAAETVQDWLGETPEISEDEITETVETEVLVVGAGNSSLMTAAKAAA